MDLTFSLHYYLLAIFAAYENDTHQKIKRTETFHGLIVILASNDTISIIFFLSQSSHIIIIASAIDCFNERKPLF